MFSTYKKLIVLGVTISLMLGTNLCWAKTVTLRFWTNHGIEDEPLFEKVVANFEKAHPNITIKYRNIAGAAYQREKLPVALAAGNLPDVFYTRGGSGDMKLLAKGIAYDFTDLLSRDSDEVDPDDFVKSQIKELQCPLGTWRSLPYDYSSLGIVYNKQIFDKVGLDYPDKTWTWMDIIEVGKKLTKEKNGRVLQWGIVEALPAGFVQWLEGVILTEGGRLFNKDYTDCIIDEPESVKVLQIFRDMYSKYRIMPAIGADGDFSSFWSGRAGMTCIGSWATLQFRHMTDFPFDVTMFPQSEDGNRVISATGGSWSMAYNTDHVEEAWEFMKHVANKESERILIVEPIRSVPARKSVWPEWYEKIKETGMYPQNAEIFGEQVKKYGRNSPTIEEAEYRWILADHWPSVVCGSKPVAEIAKKIADEINRILEK